MEFSRRRTLQLTGASLSGMALAGCLSAADPESGGNDENTTEDDDDGESGGDSDEDVDDLPIDGRLHNENAAVQTFAVTIRDVDDEEIASGEWEVAAEDSVSVPAVGRPGEPRTFEVTVDDVTATETLAFDVAATPGKKDGHVDITYTAAKTIEIAFTPIEGNDSGDDLPRVDDPPYEIAEPECGEEGDRDPLWLCENMAAEPSLAFEQVETSSAIFADEGLQLDEREGTAQYYATLLTEDDDLDRLHDEASGAAVELIEATEFDTEAVLVAQTGWGSGSKTPHLKRIEETSDGIHAFGCSRQPCLWTDDYTMRTVVARFERPASLAGGVVSLTADSETRVNFAADEGVVTLTDEQ